jgi:NADPH:quinone reductase-like Zn-dependent oxidoreductase
MRAITYKQYGSVDVLGIEEIPTPQPAADEVLIRVRAASITTADWRIRSLQMPGAMKFIGRLVFGIRGPKNKVLGTDVAGEIVAVGSAVSSYKPGDAVFGYIGKGAHAEYAIAKENAALIPKPKQLSYSDAAALPFGALCSLVFLRNFAKLKSGHRILIIGGSGNVGVYAVQIAKVLGAHVTSIASGANAELMNKLGSDAFIDYKKTDLKKLPEKFDVVFDTFGAISFIDAREILTEAGLFLPLNFSLGEALTNLAVGWIRRQKMMMGVNSNTASDLRELVDLVCQRKLRSVIDQIYAFEEFREGYLHVEQRNRRGSVVLRIDH